MNFVLKYTRRWAICLVGHKVSQTPVLKRYA